MEIDSKVWGPKYWFFLHTIAMQYSLNPTNSVKKIYYNFIQNLALMIPDKEMGKSFSKLINDYPVTPYLDSRESFVKWMHMIHNKINLNLNKPLLEYKDAILQYKENYKPKKVKNLKELKIREKIIFFLILFILIMTILFLNLKC